MYVSLLAFYVLLSLPTLLLHRSFFVSFIPRFAVFVCLIWPHLFWPFALVLIMFPFLTTLLFSILNSLMTFSPVLNSVAAVLQSSHVHLPSSYFFEWYVAQKEVAKTFRTKLRRRTIFAVFRFHTIITLDILQLVVGATDENIAEIGAALTSVQVVLRCIFRSCVVCRR